MLLSTPYKSPKTTLRNPFVISPAAAASSSCPPTTGAGCSLELVGTRAVVVRWLLDASIRAFSIRALVVVVVGIIGIGGVVGIGGAELLAVATVVHARGRARPTLQVGIPGARRQTGWASGKVVGRREVGCDRARAGHVVPSGGTTEVAAFRRIKRGALRAGIDRVSACNGHDGRIALVHGETAAGGWRLPVDGLEAILEPTGGGKLPLADDGPDGDGSDDTRCSDDEGYEDGPRKEGGTLILGLVCFLGSGRRDGGCSNEDGGATGGLCGAGLVCNERKVGCEGD